MNRMERQPVISQKDSDENENQNADPESRFKKTNFAPQFIRSSQSLSLKLNAIIRSGYFADFQTLSIFYTVLSGPNWKKVSGQISGLSQMGHSPDGQIIWNFPIEVVYQTDYLINPPQIVFVLYGVDFFGRSIPKAYGNIHFPLTQGTFRRKVRIFKISQYSFFTRAYSLITGSYYQLKEVEKILNSSEQRSSLKAQACGIVNIQFETKRYNFEKYGYDK